MLSTRSSSLFLVFAIAAALFSSAAGSTASASVKGPDADVFISRLDAVLAAGGSQNQVLFDRESGRSTPVISDQLNMFTAGASHQANIWADTILGGDFEAAGNTEVDRVEAVLAHNEVVAYHVTYSEKAWYTGNCDEEHGLAGCNEGRIVESSYVSPAVSTWIQDSSAPARFIAPNFSIR